MARENPLHPEAVERLIYLDAAYDYGLPSAEPSAKMREAIGPADEDRASYDAYREWFKKWLGFWSKA